LQLAEVLDKYYKAIGEDNYQGIESVALDGAKTYISSSKKYAVNALIVLDRFHATKKVNRAVDSVT
jgi:transposase